MKYVSVPLFIIVCMMPGRAQDTLWTQDTVLTKHHFLSTDPLYAGLGFVIGSYEYRFGKHGFLCEGQYQYPMFGTSWLSTKGYAGVIAYRFYFKPIAASSFLGLYCKYGKNKTRIIDEYDIKYVCTYRSTTLGLNWGIRKNLFKKKWLFYTYRIGAGYPIASRAWDKNPPETIRGAPPQSFTASAVVYAILDFEVSLTFGL